MGWQTFLNGIVLIVGSCALALWANQSRYRQGQRLRQRMADRRAEASAPDPDT